MDYTTAMKQNDTTFPDISILIQWQMLQIICSFKQLQFFASGIQKLFLYSARLNLEKIYNIRKPYSQYVSD